VRGVARTIRLVVNWSYILVHPCVRTTDEKRSKSSSNQEMKPIGDQAGLRKLTCDYLVRNGSKPVCVCVWPDK
jgi:hypothetical protein